MARIRQEATPLGVVDYRAIDRVTVHWYEFRGSFIGVPDWATHIGREGGCRVVAFDMYPVWDRDSGEMRSMLLTERSPENTTYMLLGTDIGDILKEGEVVDLRRAEFSLVRKSRERNLREGWQTIKKCRKTPIWERKRSEP